MNRSENHQVRKSVQLSFDFADASGASNTPSPRRVLGRNPRKEFIWNPDWRPFSTGMMPMMPKRGAGIARKPANGRSNQRA